MPGIDNAISGLSSGDSLLLVIAVAILLGLRHATDPDHLAAVSMLIASEREGRVGRAGRLGLAWGLGHATTLTACGVPVVLAGAYLPKDVRQGAEVAVGLLVVALAARLLVRWRRGRFHVHAHRHGDIEHRHLHPHGTGVAHDHVHVPESMLGRSPWQAYGIGLVHGIAGSAGVGILLLAGIRQRGVAMVALVLFALCTALSMWLLSCGFGYALTRGSVMRRALSFAPALGTASLLFGVLYTLTALQVLG